MPRSFRVSSWHKDTGRRSAIAGLAAAVFDKKCRSKPLLELKCLGCSSTTFHKCRFVPGDYLLTSDAMCIYSDCKEPFRSLLPRRCHVVALSLFHVNLPPLAIPSLCHQSKNKNTFWWALKIGTHKNVPSNMPFFLANPVDVVRQSWDNYQQMEGWRKSEYLTSRLQGRLGIFFTHLESQVPYF